MYIANKLRKVRFIFIINENNQEFNKTSLFIKYLISYLYHFDTNNACEKTNHTFNFIKDNTIRSKQILSFINEDVLEDNLFNFIVRLNIFPVLGDKIKLNLETILTKLHSMKLTL